METITLKTNINCSSCVAKVTDTLNELAGENAWKVDTQNPNKVLTIDNTTIEKEQVIEALQKIGYRAEG